MPNFTSIGEVPGEKTMTEQKNTVNLVSLPYYVWRDNNTRAFYQKITTNKVVGAHRIMCPCVKPMQNSVSLSVISILLEMFGHKN